MKAYVVWPAAVALGPIAYGLAQLGGYWAVMGFLFAFSIVAGIAFERLRKP